MKYKFHTGTTCQSVVACLSLQTEGVQHKRQMESLDQMNVFEINQIRLVLFYDSCTAKAEQWLHLIRLDHFLAAIIYQGHAQALANIVELHLQ